MAKSGSRFPYPFPLTVRVGGDIGKSIMVATNKTFSCSQGAQHAALGASLFNLFISSRLPLYSGAFFRAHYRGIVCFLKTCSF